MIERGIATFTLDEGRCPKWLFERMVKLSRQMIYKIVDEAGPDECIRRLADPVWFQSLGTVLAFDWNSSGLTTILTAALKEAIRHQEKDLGIFICGGKGKTSRKTPQEIEMWGERLNMPLLQTQSLIYNSRMSAKVDSALIQDNYQIYHHAFFFTKNGAWTVIQQGMNLNNQTARRYHWHSQNIKDLICEPHTGIVSQTTLTKVLNLTARLSQPTRTLSVQLVNQNFNALMKDVKILQKYATPISQMSKIKINENQLTLLALAPREFQFHPVLAETFRNNRYLEKMLWQLCDQRPANYEKLLAVPGVGPKTIRALALVAEVIYGAKPSYQDPARYSFAHGGKDATPYPVDRLTYDRSIDLMTKINNVYLKNHFH